MTSNYDLHIRVMGMSYKVMAIFHDIAAANEYMAEHSDESLIAEFGEYLFIAKSKDKGIAEDLVTVLEAITAQHEALLEEYGKPFGWGKITIMNAKEAIAKARGEK